MIILTNLKMPGMSTGYPNFPLHQDLFPLLTLTDKPPDITPTPAALIFSHGTLPVLKTSHLVAVDASTTIYLRLISPTSSHQGKW